MHSLSIIGVRVQSKGDLEKATGVAQYVEDIHLPGMLYGKVKRSPYPHAKILRIDTSKAEKLAGVRAVITARDVPDGLHGLGIADKPILARDVVRFVGEPVAAVAAESESVAKQAVDLIEVKYEELRAIFDPEEAFGTDPPVVIHPDKHKYKLGSVITPLMDYTRPNITNYLQIVQGDVGKGFEEADLVVENKYVFARQCTSPMEPHVYIAKWDADGNLTVWTSTQTPYRVQWNLSQALKMPLTKIRVIQPWVGGGFGGKAEGLEESICAVLAQKSGRPVLLGMSREEELTCGRQGTPFIIHIKDGVKKDGTITTRYIRYIMDVGAYCGISYLIVRNASYGAIGQYKYTNFKLEGYGVYTNNPPSGPIRGFGSPAVLFAIEQQMDIIAEKLGIDPVEIRKKNLLKEGDRTARNEEVHSIGVEECLEKVAEAIGWGKRPRREDLGKIKRGVAIAIGNKYSVAPTMSSAFVKVHPDATVEIRTAASDMGQGIYSALAQIAAEEFKVTIEKVRVIFGDTSICPPHTAAVSSQQTYTMGNAVRLACQDAKRQIFELAAKKLGDVRPDELDINGEIIYVKKPPSKVIKLIDLYQIPYMAAIPYLVEGAEIIGKATYISRADPLDPETGRILEPVWGRSCSFYSYMAQAVEVEVDTETGEVRILKFVAAGDCGKAINPLVVEGQIEGGLQMGIGAALYEHCLLKDGEMLNPTLTDYKICTAKDIPLLENIKTMVVECPHRDGPYGAKGIGEAVCTPSPALIMNAIYNAIGIRFFEYPISPEKILAALRARRAC